MPPLACEKRRRSSCAKRSSAMPTSIPTTTPGLVQNCPTPRFTDWTRPSTIASRARRMRRTTRTQGSRCPFRRRRELAPGALRRRHTDARPAFRGARKRTCFDSGMLDQSQTHIRIRTLHHAEYARRQSKRRDRFANRSRDKLRSLRMPGVRLDDDRAPCGQMRQPCRRPRRRTPAENCSRTIPPQDPAESCCDADPAAVAACDPAARDRCARLSISLANHVREHAKLIHRTPRSPVSRSFGNAVSAPAKSSSGSPNARISSAIFSRNCAMVSGGKAE